MATEDLIERIIVREGLVYTNRAADRGGPTKFGITIRTLSEVRARPCTAAEVRDLTIDEARAIYRPRYVDAPGFWRIRDPFVQELVVDCGVNHGPARAARWLQTAAGLRGDQVDGIVGRGTAALANGKDPRALFADILCIRNSFYEDLDDNDPRQEENEDGWVNRVNEFIRMLARMPAGSLQRERTEDGP